MSLLISLALAAAAGWVASMIFKGSQFGFLGYLVIGIIGGIIGQFVFKYFAINIIGGYLGEFLYALAGALLLLFIMSLFRGRRKDKK